MKKISRRTFLKGTVAAAALATMGENAFASEKFADIPIRKTTNVGKVTPITQAVYDALNEQNFIGRSYCIESVGADTITAALADELNFGNGDKHTSTNEIYNLTRQQINAKKQQGTAYTLFIPVVGIKKEKAVAGMLAPTNNPLDYEVAEKTEGLWKRRRHYHRDIEAMVILQEGAIGIEQWWGTPDAKGIIAVQYLNKQKNNPFVVTAFYKPYEMKDNKILSLEKIIPAEYNLRAKEITANMTTNR